MTSTRSKKGRGRGGIKKVPASKKVTEFERVDLLCTCSSSSSRYPTSSRRSDHQTISWDIFSLSIFLKSSSKFSFYHLLPIALPSRFPLISPLPSYSPVLSTRFKKDTKCIAWKGPIHSSAGQIECFIRLPILSFSSQGIVCQFRLILEGRERGRRPEATRRRGYKEGG